MPDERHRTKETDDARGGDGSRADVENVSLLNLLDRHVGNAVSSFRRKGQRSGGAEKFDRRNEDEIGQDATTHHERGDARTDDVTDTEERGIVLERNRRALEWLRKNFLRHFLHDFEDLLQAVIDEPNRETADDNLAAADRFVRRGARNGIAGVRSITRFSGRGGLQDFCARRAFRILQVTVLLHDERAAQRDHHQNANQSAESRDQHDACDLEIEPENHDRRHGHAETEGD